MRGGEDVKKLGLVRGERGSISLMFLGLSSIFEYKDTQH